MLMLSGCTNTAQDDKQAFPPDVVAEIQANIDDLTAGERPPGMVAWLDVPGYQFAGASGPANRMEDILMPLEGAFRIGSITKMFTAAVIIQIDSHLKPLFLYARNHSASKKSG